MEEWSITQLQEMMSDGRMNGVTAVQHYLTRIQQIDQQNPKLNSVLILNPNALEIAAALDAERAATGPRSPLHGIPILLKDNIETADPMPTTAGSLALAQNFATQDSFVAERLRAAGAIILGKTNLSEWANFRSTRSSSGWSSTGGQVRHPYAQDRNPCGSSSGSGVAVAANLCAAAIGTETDGSIVCPSHANGIVGLKPTVGLIGRSGIVPISHSQDTAGPMTRTVRDAAIILGALVGNDPRDPATKVSVGNSHTGYTQFLDKNGLQDARIGVSRNYFGYNPHVDALIEQAVEMMRQQGATIIDPADIETKGQFSEAEYEVFLYEFKHNLNNYLSTTPKTVTNRTLADLIDYNDANKEKVMPYFAQENFTAAQAKGPLTDKTYVDALANSQRLARAEGIDATLEKYQLDAIVAPTGGPAWLTDWVNGDHYGGSSSSPAAIAGYPNITIPAGYVFGLPIGISFIGGAWQEPTLLRLAYAFEQASQVRQRPQFLKTLTFD
ncbi:Putative secreted amidase SCO6344 [hydrothermal vent metagenome]|uniref:Secreted amidase SCO6344 n=1 Tax=hydrothermal vent metagenome TaxID=652676 RepID=A0A3B0UG79_9ZZZZ